MGVVDVRFTIRGCGGLPGLVVGGLGSFVFGSIPSSSIWRGRNVMVSVFGMEKSVHRDGSSSSVSVAGVFYPLILQNFPSSRFNTKPICAVYPVSCMLNMFILPCWPPRTRDPSLKGWDAISHVIRGDGRSIWLGDGDIRLTHDPAVQHSHSYIFCRFLHFRIPIVAKCDRQRVLSSWEPYCSNMIPLELEIEFSSVRSRSPQQFVEKLAQELHLRGVAAGESYRCGFRAAGDSSALVRLCEEYGIGARIIPSVMDKNQSFIHMDTSNSKES